MFINSTFREKFFEFKKLFLEEYGFRELEGKELEDRIEMLEKSRPYNKEEIELELHIINDKEDYNVDLIKYIDDDEEIDCTLSGMRKSVNYSRVLGEYFNEDYDPQIYIDNNCY